MAIGCTVNCERVRFTEYSSLWRLSINNHHKLEYSLNNCTRSAVHCAADCYLYSSYIKALGVKSQGLSNTLLCIYSCLTRFNPKINQPSKGGRQKLLSGFFPLRGGVPPLPLTFFEHNDFPLRGGVPPKSVKEQIRKNGYF